MFSWKLLFLWLIDKKTLSNSVCNRTRDKLIGLPLRGRPTFSSLVWLQTPLSPITSTYMIIVNSRKLLCCCSWWETGFLQVMSSFIWRMSLKTNIFIAHEDHWWDVRPQRFNRVALSQIHFSSVANFAQRYTS